ncbi:MAG: excinuclease ABC subunit UvrB [Phycisphaeraceae bacterium]|nr:excinuclease ABC subunit UvrB [Phycisphaeraceae bacterium]
MPRSPRDEFQLVSDMRPTGDQPQAIDALVEGIQTGKKYQTLMGATGTGKTFTMANVIARVNRPALVISHNKTLAAQLYEEFRDLFPDAAVCYFVSYYDYYQPEAYIPQRDIYIEKDASRNDNLDRLRLAATSALVSRRDVIVVASVSCIFGLGSPDEYKRSVLSLAVGQTLDRRQFFLSLNDMQYTRAEMDFQRRTYRVRGDVIEVFPGDEEFAYRIGMFGDEIESLALINPTSGELLSEDKQIFIFPAVHYIVSEDRMQRALQTIAEELDQQVLHLRHEGKLLEAQRLLARTKYDLEMIQEVGYCSGIENYSRHLDGRPPGSKPYTLLDYFPDAQSGTYQGGYVDGSRDDIDYPDQRLTSSSETSGGGNTSGGGDASGDWLLIIDESHVTLPQLHAMYNGDQQRKKVLVDHGFRLPSAMDNRPLRFEEIEKLWPQVVFVTATPGPYELKICEGAVVEQIIRPTGLVDPWIEVRGAQGQVPDLVAMAQQRAKQGERTIVTTLTKRLAEDLASYMAEKEIKCRYLHSDIETLDRVTILRELREGDYDVLVGVNLLREGLDLPEVSLVAIMDADKAGFLRSPTSLIQQIGRAARNVNATVILYGDQITPAMQRAMDETSRRREIQIKYNADHGITPQTIRKEIRRGIEVELRAMQTARAAVAASEQEYDRLELIAELEKKMHAAAAALEFERAATLRDQVKELKAMPEMGKVSRGKTERKTDRPGTPGKRTPKFRRKGGANGLS